MCPDQPRTEDRDLRKHGGKTIIAEWQHQPKREEEHGPTELLGGRPVATDGADSILRATLHSSLQVAG